MILWLCIAGMIIGALLLAAGLRGRRVGDRPHCRRCGYDLSGTPNQTCSECGADLSRPGATAIGRRQRRAGLAWGGLALLLVAALPLAASVLGLRGDDWKPTFVLLWESPGDAGARRELAGRWADGRLSDAAAAELTAQAMAAHAAEVWDETWWPVIEEAIRQDALDDEQKRAVALGAADLAMVVRPKVQRGRQPQLGIRASGNRLGPFQRGANTTVTVSHILHRFSVDDEPQSLDPQIWESPRRSDVQHAGGWVMHHVPTPAADGEADMYAASLSASYSLQVPGATPIVVEDVPIEWAKTVEVTDGLTGEYVRTEAADAEAATVRARPVVHDGEMAVKLFFAGDNSALADRNDFRVFVHVGGKVFEADERAISFETRPAAGVDVMTAVYDIVPNWPEGLPQPDYPAQATVVLRTDVATAETAALDARPVWSGEVRFEGVTLDPATAAGSFEFSGSNQAATAPFVEPTAVEPLDPTEAERRNDLDAAAAATR